MGSVYKLTLRQLSGRWRLAIMTVLSAMPVIITTAMVSGKHADSLSEFEEVVLSAMLSGSIMPLIVLAIAAASFGNEIEDKTLANLMLSPIPRWQIALPKLLAVITIAAPFIALSALLTGYIAFLGDMRSTFAIVIPAVAGVAMYASLFVWLGLVSTQAIGVGLLYIVLWEGFFAGFISGMRLLSVRYYAMALMHGMDARRFDGAQDVTTLVAVIMSALVIGGFLMLSIRRLRRMDTP